MSYSDLDLIAEVRELVGKPSKDEVSDRRLRRYLTSGLEWLAEELKYSVVTDSSTVALVAGTQEYALPAALLTLVWAEWATNRLEPASTYQWTRDGLDWRDETGNPTQYAMEGRKLVLYPVPTAATISTASALTFRYISATPGLSATGTGSPGLSDGDQTLLKFYAAALYCAARPSQENMLRQQSFNAQVAQLLRGARRRHQESIEDNAPEARVWSRRTGAAR